MGSPFGQVFVVAVVERGECFCDFCDFFFEYFIGVLLEMLIFAFCLSVSGVSSFYFCSALFVVRSLFLTPRQIYFLQCAPFDGVDLLDSEAQI